jgi:hypothetical protein
MGSVPSGPGTAPRPLRSPLFTLLLGGSALAGSAIPAAAQDLSFSAGQGLYAEDEECLESEAFLTSFQLGLSGDSYGFSASYEHEDWPWPDPPPELESAFTHGDAFTAQAELYPLAFVGVDQGRFRQFLRPFVAAGVHVSRDGEPGRLPNGETIYGIRGGVDPIVSAGASAIFRPATLPVAIQVQYRHNVLFGSDFQFEDPAGVVFTAEGSETLSWGQLTAGISIPLGG